ncbi:GCN5-related N-acetyltransferase [Alkaliphilus metalliredigens QYMF]|uniref:GCN5-related N-acetyltransferase n=1 Tax=Alkaliphilus metalliredigens (strain QYMF) TaxID=293826 RepID=A6TLC6_ALKMQ|nr:GNAT family N-acetyltransferase [Alkaliphilus metalliredigens]ABR46994.1 GCN5-related N-acetyltransferase [Alkaliphilus metalliredigens QYMF]
MTVITRNIKKEDKEEINKLIQVLNKRDDLGYSITDEWLDYVIQEAGEGIFVAVYEEKLIGLATCMINQMDKTQAAINVVIHPEYRSQGFGSTLYYKVMNYVKDKKIKAVETYVKKRLHNAVGFAQKRNFETVLYSWHMELELNEANFQLLERQNIVFRKAIMSDDKSYAQIINQCFGDGLDNSALGHLLRDPSIRVYMLEGEGEVIGTTTMQLREKLSLGYIYDVAIIEQYRGQGLGSYMLKNCLDELKHNHINKASLLVAGGNKNALALYERVGFKEVDTDMIMQKII